MRKYRVTSNHRLLEKHIYDRVRAIVMRLERKRSRKLAESASSEAIDVQIDYVKSVGQLLLTQLPALDSRIAYVLTGNGVVLGVELLIIFSGGISQPVFYALFLISFFLVLLSSTYSVIANMPGDFLMSYYGTQEEKRKMRELGQMRLGESDVRNLSKSGIMARMIKTNEFLEIAVRIKLKRHKAASLLLILSFMVLLVLLMLKYWQVSGFRIS